MNNWTPGLYASNRLILWYVNYILTKLLKSFLKVTLHAPSGNSGWGMKHLECQEKGGDQGGVSGLRILNICGTQFILHCRWIPKAICWLTYIVSIYQFFKMLFICSAEYQTQGLEHDRPALYPWVVPPAWRHLLKRISEGQGMIWRALPAEGHLLLLLLILTTCATILSYGQLLQCPLIGTWAWRCHFWHCNIVDPKLRWEHGKEVWLHTDLWLCLSVQTEEALVARIYNLESIVEYPSNSLGIWPLMCNLAQREAH